MDVGVSCPLYWKAWRRESARFPNLCPVKSCLNGQVRDSCTLLADRASVQDLTTHDVTIRLELIIEATVIVPAAPTAKGPAATRARV